MKARKKELSLNRWTRSSDKEQYWRMHLQAWAASGLSIRAYCQENGVVETSFYAWRRELGIRDREQLGTGSVDPGVEAGTVKDRRGRSIPKRFREDLPIVKEGEQTESLAPFVRLNLVEDGSACKEARTLDRFSDGILGITLTTPGGYAISLTRISDIEQLKVVLEKLEERTC